MTKPCLLQVVLMFWLTGSVCLAGCRQTQSSQPSTSDGQTITDQETDQETDAAVSFGKRTRLGKFDTALIDESSGLAISLQNDGYFWTHNDNGQRPGLFLFDKTGKHRGTLQLDPRLAPFRDWESLDSATIEGRHYLFLGDIGDNASQHETCRIHVIEEPAWQLDDAKVIEETSQPITTIAFRYQDGPRDCEALAFDTDQKRFYLFSKFRTRDAKQDRSLIYWLPWQTQSNAQPIEAKAVASEFDFSNLTAADISPSGDLAIVRSYTSAWLFQRQQGETWAQAFASPGPSNLMPLQLQGEAICFDSSGQAVVLTSEGVSQTIWEVKIDR